MIFHLGRKICYLTNSTGNIDRHRDGVSSPYALHLTFHKEIFSENKVLILSICLLVVVLLLGAGLDVGLYFTKRRGILNAIINRQVRSSGTRHLSSENSSSGTEEEQRLSPDE